jgi:hypothetical protein
MPVLRKLMQARIALQNTKLEKSGENKFAGYKYFELGDFLPTIQQLFSDLDLCGVVSYSTEYASLTITDTEDASSVVITSPLSEANLKGAHPIQNLGAVESYQRRYLWMTALEIVENDIIDSSAGAELPKPAAKVTPPKIIEGDGKWKITVTAGTDSENWLTVVGNAVDVALSAAQSLDHVMTIYSTNKNIMDKLKEVSTSKYSEVMAKFTAAKVKFKKD